MKISKFDISQIDDIVSMHQVEFVDYWGKEELLNSIAKSDTLFLVILKKTAINIHKWFFCEHEFYLSLSST